MIAGAAERRVHFIEVLTVVIAIGWGVVTWQDTLARFGTFGWARMLLGYALWVLAIGALAWIVRHWKALRFRALVPAAIVALAFASMPLVESKATQRKEALFLAGTPPFLDLIAQVRTGLFPTGSIPSGSLPAALHDCCFQVNVERDSAGAVTGFFVTDMAFGPRFSGWVYTDTDTLSLHRSFNGMHFSGRKVTDRWYRFREIRDQ